MMMINFTRFHVPLEANYSKTRDAERSRGLKLSALLRCAGLTACSVAVAGGKVILKGIICWIDDEMQTQTELN